jgi:trehalose 6-phosphate synthase/phosphatase
MDSVRITDKHASVGQGATRSADRAGRLLVMSNRAPIEVVNEGGRERVEPTVGGVGSTFLRLLERYGGLWIAWSGGSSGPMRTMLPPLNPRFAMSLLRLSERDVSNYYYGMCNRGLWPLMHFMTLNCRFDTVQWRSYCEVNRTFAKAAEAESALYDTVWVQDFHLALTPGLIRERNPQKPIGLFWHVPWPPEQVFRVFPWRSELLAGMLGSDLIGFHTPTYVSHFLDGCERIMGFEVDRATGDVFHNSRRTRVGAFPLGIAADYFHDLSTTERVQRRAHQIRSALHTKTLMLGVDRLDYTKGIGERLLGFERFLESSPQHRKHITLVLIAVPSRTRVSEYATLKKLIDELVGRVIGRFSSHGWVPIRYLYTQFPTEELVAYYQAADIALVTPLRDGMNLVAKEYVASRLTDNSALILSEFAGAALELKAALQVNPYDIDQIASGIRRAVEMTVEERQERFAQLRKGVQKNNLDRWSEKFLRALTNEDLVGAKAALA